MSKRKHKPCCPVATHPWKNKRKTIKEIREKFPKPQCQNEPTTYREACIDYVKRTMRSAGYRDYIVFELEKIEQIVNKWNNDASHSFSDMCKINGILEQDN